MLEKVCKIKTMRNDSSQVLRMGNLIKFVVLTIADHVNQKLQSFKVLL